MRISRRQFIDLAVGGGSALALASVINGPVSAAAASSSDPELVGELFVAPVDPSEWPRFRESLHRWRERTKAELKYSDALYRRSEYAWAAANYCCCFLMLWDERFYDRESGEYSVESFLDGAQREFGGFDSVVLWHAYPRIGVDDRNQFDFYRDQPGGLPGLRDAVRRFRRRGVRTYVNYNPWDIGTRREDKPDLEAVAEIVRELEVDGVFLDTMRNADELRAKLDSVRTGVIMEGEFAVPLASVHNHHASWAQGFLPPPLSVLRHKWLERRHMQHQVDRWNHNHLDELRCAWMNGSGMMVWENVFGSLNPWNPRDRSWLRAMLPIQRRYSDILSGEGWTPFVATEQGAVIASQWQGDGVRLWTLINNSWRDVEGYLIKVTDVPAHAYFDLMRGEEAQVRRLEHDVLLSGRIPARGLGCLISIEPSRRGPDFAQFLKEQGTTWVQADWRDDIPEIETDVVSPQRLPTARSKQLGTNMVEIPSAELEIIIKMPMRESGLYRSTDWACRDAAPRGHCLDLMQSFRRVVKFKRFAMDESLVTNAEYARFVRESGYRPRHSENFLKHWGDDGPAPEIENHPVVYVDLDDARAYAAWAGKRLPTEEEWQYAAQGTDGREYPWGMGEGLGAWNGVERVGTMPVKAFPEERSPFGCYDLCGNVWQLTEGERTDGRTRFSIIRGGSWFEAKGAIWYVPGGPQPVNVATKFIMCWPGLDRCSTIGFRCAADLE